MPTEADYRLPRTVVPSHYRLRHEPDLEAAAFSGTASVDVRVVEPVEEIVLHSAELEIDQVLLVGGDGSRIEATVSYDEETEEATLALERPAEPGAWVLEMEFRGILNDRLRGFYRSTYEAPDGSTKTIATTQFAVADARRAFPCWDEPDLKASFDVTLVVDDGLLAISNARETSRSPAGPGRVAVSYATTMKMSTYLLAFIVGDLEATDAVDVDGTPLRIVYPPGNGHLTELALEAGAFSLRYYTDYYGIPYPGDKLDMIAIPDFAAGAMENLGAVTYRETALLVDKERATQAELARVADVVAHEIAHMWFGDLVTMKWWNGIWLNEAFATFAAAKCVDAFRPEWKTWLAFSAERARSMDTDALVTTRAVEFPVASPDDANEMFDVLTYEKGSSVLRMIEQYLGEDAFRRGVSAYLQQHEYGNTETADLWAALEAASDEPVGEIMDTWIFQGGFPQLAVERTPNGYRISQEHFRYLSDGDQRWQVPVLFRSSAGEGRRLLTGEVETIEAGSDLVVNAGGSGFYRVLYRGDLAEDIRSRVGSLDPAERYSVVADLWANVLSGDSEAGDLLRLIGDLEGESEVDIWQLMLTALGELDRVVSSDVRPDLQRFVRGAVSGRMDDFGWSPDPDEDDRTRKLRGALIRALGVLGEDPETQREARNVRSQMEEDGSAVDAEVADAALAVVAASGDLSDFDHFLEASASATSPQDVVKYLRAAATVPDRDAARRMFKMVLDGSIRSQDSFWVTALMLGHRVNGPYVWELIKEHWDELLEVLPPANTDRILDLLMFRSEPGVSADIEAWLAEHPIKGGAKPTAQQLEKMRVRVGLRERESSRLGETVR